tara:strand:- start:2041 stop:2403 length:363 start_codon:yes stop_codon:yes gene_type:complete
MPLSLKENECVLHELTYDKDAYTEFNDSTEDRTIKRVLHGHDNEIIYFQRPDQRRQDVFIITKSPMVLSTHSSSYPHLSNERIKDQSDLELKALATEKNLPLGELYDIRAASSTVPSLKD